MISRYLVSLFAVANLAHAGTTAPSAAGAETLVLTPSAARPTATVAETSMIGAPSSEQPTEDASIRPFRVHVPQEAIDDLRQRIAMTRWPDKETVPDRSQGIRLAELQEL